MVNAGKVNSRAPHILRADFAGIFLFLGLFRCFKSTVKYIRRSNINRDSL
jgi:hypothetical protein